ncbi:transporter substrate-binding domain-containing protein [Aerococcaceae bacterium WGS1372]
MKKIMQLMSGFILIFMLVSVSTVNSVAATFEEIKNRGQLIVGMNAEYPPFEWVELVDGQTQIVGIDASIGQLIADEIGVELVIDNRAFDSLIPSLNTDKIDLIISGMSNTEERAKVVDFSVAYYEPVSQFAVNIEDSENYQTIEDFNGKKVGALLTSTQDIYIKEYMPEVELVSMGKNGDLVEALKAKKVDAILMSDLTLQQYLTNYGDSMMIVPNLDITNELLGTSVAIAKDNTELLEVVDKVINKAKESGQLEQIFAENIEAATKKQQ